jgi:hypothetical protein
LRTSRVTFGYSRQPTNVDKLLNRLKGLEHTPVQLVIKPWYVSKPVKTLTLRKVEMLVEENGRNDIRNIRDHDLRTAEFKCARR